MPASSARCTGASNAWGSTIGIAIAARRGLLALHPTVQVRRRDRRCATCYAARCGSNRVPAPWFPPVVKFVGLTEGEGKRDANQPWVIASDPSMADRDAP